MENGGRRQSRVASFGHARWSDSSASSSGGPKTFLLGDASPSKHVASNGGAADIPPAQPELFRDSFTVSSSWHTADAADSVPPTSVLATPPAQSPRARDYFDEDAFSPHSKRPLGSRTNMAEAPEQQGVKGQVNGQSAQHQNAIYERRRSSQVTRRGSREAKEAVKKALLSKALQKANTAVLLDNAQNFQGALDAYEDACRLLGQVMDRTSGPDDFQKLDDVRATYLTRIAELHEVELQPFDVDDKVLPARPMSDDSLVPSLSHASPPEIGLASPAELGRVKPEDECDSFFSSGSPGQRKTSASSKLDDRLAQSRPTQRIPRKPIMPRPLGWCEEELELAEPGSAEFGQDAGTWLDTAENPAVQEPVVDYQQVSKPSIAMPLVKDYAEDAVNELDEADEEERILDDFTQNYSSGFNLDLSTSFMTPRKSDSSALSRSTWQSSQASADRTLGSSLSTVAEDAHPVRNPMRGSIASIREHISNLPNRGPGVRNIRGSGGSKGHIPAVSGLRRSSVVSVTRMEDNETPKPQQPEASKLLSPPSLDLRSASSDNGLRLRTSTLPGVRQSFEEVSLPREVIPRPGLLRQNKSSINLREQSIPPTSPEQDAVPPLAMPMGSGFHGLKQRGNSNADFLRSATSHGDSQPTGGSYLFDTSLKAHSAHSPSSFMAPAALEPCPESSLLRPYWLMRTILSTLIHPQGGFITTQLFIPREAWLTRGVKLRHIEDKIANIDLLTASLSRLNPNETSDVQTIIAELSSVEEVMDRVRSALTKRLGNDVGGRTVTADNGEVAPTTSRGKSGYGYLSSWKKLRGKSSTKDQQSGFKERGVRMGSVPMIAIPGAVVTPTTSATSSFEGPQKEYMGSLVRLFSKVPVLGKKCISMLRFGARLTVTAQKIWQDRQKTQMPSSRHQSRWSWRFQRDMLPSSLRFISVVSYSVILVFSWISL
ncbi:hypothetical protein K470DRAFT_259438 [Piedraia hortae CBS 480.64]|uniref:MIT domain-containing protein n=1 Tax=Piedraia hortae CBS 480.64 TaxID=1314780 RepID=A0A6A7BVS7_9PEZI|nr:hypothetical protein K470DRAFT_259438 [Piedraia hortae CBS 480.64]